MLSKLLKTRKNTESGFTLVELLVVILIIGILAAIAIPIFLNQRQRANDATVESDVRNVATAIESQLISSPNASTIEGASNGADQVDVEVSGTEPVTVPLSDGVNIEIEGYGQSADGSDLHANGYEIHGWHDNGRQYDGTPNTLVYDSALGGFQTEPGTITGGGGPDEGDLQATPAECFGFNPGAGTIAAYLGPNGENCTTDVVIPSEINGTAVTSIGAAFGGRGLTSVVIPNSVTSIGGNAFPNNNLQSVTIPDSVETIGSFAFGMNGIDEVAIPNSVTTIGSYAFQSNNLTSVTIGNAVTRIASAAFSDNNLTSVTIPDSVTSIENAAFSNNSLTSVAIPNSVTSIENAAFSNNNLTSVTIPNSVTRIGGGAFYGNNLTSVTIPDSVTTIETGAFEGNNLTSVELGPNTQYHENTFDEGVTVTQR